MQFEHAGTPVHLTARVLCLVLASVAAGCASPVTGFVTGVQVFGDTTVRPGTSAYAFAIVSGEGEFNGAVTWAVVSGVGTLQANLQGHPTMDTSTLYAMPVTATIGEVDTLKATSVGNPYFSENFTIQVVGY